MTGRSIFDIVQIVTGLAVVAGLVVVILELRQAHEIARAEQTNEFRSKYDKLATAEMGEILPAALANACRSPQDLTDAEFVALNAYYISLLMVVRNSYLEKGEDIASRTTWRDYAIASFDSIFLTAPGRAWWREKVQLDWLKIPDEVRDLGNDHLDSAPATCFIDGWRDAIVANHSDV
jgi:hypothetical protein